MQDATARRLRLPLPTNRVLSVRQPHAQRLVTRKDDEPTAYKWCENRTWIPPLEDMPRASDGYPRLLIHAAGTVEANRCAILRERKHQWRTSAVIGYVRLLGYVQTQRDNHSSLLDSVVALFDEAESVVPMHGWELLSIRPGVVWWIMDQPHKLYTPIPSPGKLKVWTL